MKSDVHRVPERATVATSLALTLLQIGSIEASWLLALVLPLQWALILRPIERREWAMFAIVGPLFVAQGYVALRSGAIAFRQQDFLLMPWHEPLLWMGWYLHIVRFVAQPAREVRLDRSAWIGLLLTVLAFSAFGGDVRATTLAASVSCAVLLAMFHSRGDLAYGLCAVSLGLLVEGVGVANGLWSYPGAGFAGIPGWSVMMWMSVGLLGRRFVLPLAEWLARPWEAGLRGHGGAMTIRQLAHAIGQRRRRAPREPASHAPSSALSGDAPPSTLFKGSTFSPEFKGKGFKIRIAKRPSVLQDAIGLLNRRYRQRGYGFQTLSLSPERMTIVAYEDKQVIGTLTVQLDAGRGMLSDECFKQELDGFRARGASLCEFTKLATAPLSPMPATLASMFHVAFIFAHQISRATHVVVEVNPRHVAFYTRVLGFSAHGTPQSNPRVKAPGVLLVADFEHIGRQLLARDAPGAGEPPPFFSHSFSNTEEEGIRNRIQAALAQQEMAA